MAQGSSEAVIGRITSVFGVRGWLKVYSYTDPMEGLLDYRDWVAVFDGEAPQDQTGKTLGAGRRLPLEVVEGRRHGPGLVVRIRGVDDRETARSYCGAEIRVATEQLPELPEGEYYWHQLEGLQVDTLEGDNLGRVDHLIETGSNDVLIVQPTGESRDQRERLIPYLPEQVVRQVDLSARRMLVDWDPEF